MNAEIALFLIQDGLTNGAIYALLALALALVLLIISVAVHFAMTGLGLVFFGAEGSRTPAFSEAQWKLGILNVSGQSLWVIGASVALIFGLYLFFRRTIYGKALRATAINRTGARLVFGAFLLFMLAAPHALSEFHVTLLNYIGLYSLVALGLVLLTGVGGIDLVWPGGIRGTGRLCHRLPCDGFRRVAMADFAHSVSAYSRYFHYSRLAYA